MPSESDKKRQQLRHLQDDFLCLPSVGVFISEHGKYAPLWDGGPSYFGVLRMIYQQHEAEFRAYIADEGQ